MKKPEPDDTSNASIQPQRPYTIRFPNGSEIVVSKTASGEEIRGHPPSPPSFHLPESERYWPGPVRDLP